MKKAKLMAVIVLSGLLLYGCVGGGSSTFPPEQNAVYVNRNGEIYTALVGAYDASHDYYDSEELKARAEEEAAAYNAEHPVSQTASEGVAAAVTLTECSLENGMAKLVFRYLTGEDLCQFTEVSQDEANHVESLHVSTVADGLKDANVAGGTWVDVKKNTTIDAGDIMKQSKLRLVAVTGAASIQTEGKILYYSGNLNLKDEFTAEVTDGTAYLVFK